MARRKLRRQMFQRRRSLAFADLLAAI